MAPIRAHNPQPSSFRRHLAKPLVEFPADPEPTRIIFRCETPWHCARILRTEPSPTRSSGAMLRPSTMPVHCWTPLVLHPLPPYLIPVIRVKRDSDTKSAGRRPPARYGIPPRIPFCGTWIENCIRSLIMCTVRPLKGRQTSLPRTFESSLSDSCCCCVPPQRPRQALEDRYRVDDLSLESQYLD